MVIVRACHLNEKKSHSVLDGEPVPPKKGGTGIDLCILEVMATRKVYMRLHSRITSPICADAIYQSIWHQITNNNTIMSVICWSLWTRQSFEPSCQTRHYWLCTSAREHPVSDSFSGCGFLVKKCAILFPVASLNCVVLSKIHHEYLYFM